MSTPYRLIPNAITNRAYFKGNSMTGFPMVGFGGRRADFPDPEKLVPDHADYVVMSYWTPIGYAIGDTLYVTATRYSATTDRHQNILRGLGAVEIGDAA